MNLPLRISTETLAMLMIGDGALMLLQPRRHMSVWNTGPTAWRELVSYFEERPGLTMAVGAAQVAAGVWLASGVRGEERELEHAAEPRAGEPRPGAESATLH